LFHQPIDDEACRFEAAAPIERNQALHACQHFSLGRPHDGCALQHQAGHGDMPRDRGRVAAVVGVAIAAKEALDLFAH
jgi:hypothetical protein